MAKELTSRQLIAIREYLKGRTKTEALRIAGYSESICTTKHSHIFDNPLVQAEIQRRQRMEEQKNQLNADYIRDNLIKVVESLDAKDGDKLRALELLGRSLGMFTDRVEVTSKEDLVERLQKGRERVAKLRVVGGAGDV